MDMVNGSYPAAASVEEHDPSGNYQDSAGIEQAGVSRYCVS
jgi:hypothetical protein